MADKPIGELNSYPYSTLNSNTLFVVQAPSTTSVSTAYKLTAQQLENWLVATAQGHGGISSIAKTATAGLVDTYTITYADTTTSVFTVTNAKSISSITSYYAVSSSNTTAPTTWQTTMPTMTSTNRYLWSYNTITYNNSTTSDTTKCVIGVYGDTGAAWYVHIRWADQQPTQDSHMYPTTETSGHPWMGIYSGTSATAPTTYTSYIWYQIKGATGATGAAATLSSSEIKYGVSASADTQPSSWQDTMPTVGGGQYLWTRTTLTFNTGNPVVYYSKTRYGIDGTGTGTVTSVNGISPVNGNVTTVLMDSSDPTTATVGEVKQMYINTETGVLFVCTSVVSGVYTWLKLGSNPTVSGEKLILS